MQLSRRGFFFGLGTTLAVIRTPGLIMPIKEALAMPPRVPLGASYTFYLDQKKWAQKHGYYPDDPDADIRIQAMMEAGGPDRYVPDTEFRKVYLEHDDGFTNFDPMQRVGFLDNTPIKIAKVT